MDKPREHVSFDARDYDPQKELMSIDMERGLKSVLPKNYKVEDLVSLLIKENIFIDESVLLQMTAGDLYKYRHIDTSYKPEDVKHDSFQKFVKEKGIKKHIYLAIDKKGDRIEVYVSKGNHTLYTAMENGMGNTNVFVQVSYSGI